MIQIPLHESDLESLLNLLRASIQASIRLIDQETDASERTILERELGEFQKLEQYLTNYSSNKDQSVH